MKGEESRDIEDTVKLIILHLMACVLFVVSSDIVHWWMFRVCEDLYDMRHYNWEKCVVELI